MNKLIDFFKNFHLDLLNLSLVNNIIERGWFKAEALLLYRSIQDLCMYIPLHVEEGLIVICIYRTQPQYEI